MKKEKITNIKQCPDLNPFKNLTPREKMLLNIYDIEFAREFLIKKIKKNSFTALAFTEAFPGIIPESAKIEVDTSAVGKTFKNDEIYAVFFVDDGSFIKFGLKRIFLSGHDIILSSDKKSDYSTLRLKDTKPEDVILGRLSAVNSKPLKGK
ncbi:MAG: hypothetical protein ACYCSQ_07520 [bacterium]